MSMQKKRQHKSGGWIFLGLALILSGFSYSVWHKEQILKTGEKVFIELAPVDPRSIMQGDYMILNYAIPQKIRLAAKKQQDGLLVYTLDKNKVMILLGVANKDKKLHSGERHIVFRYRGRRIQLGANSFFFQEGKATLFEAAKFGEVRVDEHGNTILVALRDEKHQLLGVSSGLN